MTTPFISKSKYLKGLQCPKLVWHAVHRREIFPPVDAFTQQIFDQGHQVGALAKTLFPGGMDVPWTDGPGGALRETPGAMSRRVPLFEASFQVVVQGLGVFAAVDVLEPQPDGSWDLIEVKSTTSVKDVHLQDLALQRLVCEESGLAVRRTRLMHVTREYVRKGDLEPREILITQDVTDTVEKLLPSCRNNLARMRSVLELDTPPEVPIGRHCDDPYECALKGLCWAFLPEEHVFQLSRGKNKACALLARGILDIRDIPGDTALNRRQSIQVECARSGEPRIDQPAIARFLKGLDFPLHYLDFETINPALPLFDGLRPYDPLPFQFSLHVQKRPGGPSRHCGFLADLKGGSHDPRKDFLDGLRKGLGRTGTILAYNADFETRVLKACSESFPGYASWLKDSVLPRVVDLLKPFRSFDYYHPKQMGSASIKSVLPALTGQGYANLAIADGGTASSEFLRISLNGVPDSEVQAVRARLEDYCAMDTLGMAKIVDELFQVVDQARPHRP